MSLADLIWRDCVVRMRRGWVTRGWTMPGGALRRLMRHGVAFLD